MSLEFRGLGAVEVWCDSRKLALGGANQRGLLALLMLEPNQVVAVERLIDRLWPAGRADRTTLYRSVSRLRGVLSASGHDVLVNRAGGYLLTIDPAQVDIHRFQRLVRDGRLELASNQVEAAARLLGEALALWRGSALTGVPEAVRERHATSLEELRVLALEERVAADLMLGRHEQLIPELREQVDEHPWRERLTVHLMDALYSSGRRAEAIEVYGRTRRRMVDELGLEPGPELRQLQQRLLADQPDVEARHDARRQAGQASSRRRPATATAPVPRFRPAELPSAIPNFVGRLHEVGQLCALLTRPSGHAVPIAAVSGGAGAGKTTLAIQVAHAVSHRFPDGVQFANLHGSTPERTPTAPIEVLGRFLRGCGFRGREVPATVEEASARFRSATAGRRLLVVLDDALDAEQVRPLIPAGAGCAVLLTSRRVPATLEAATHVRLAGMSDYEAVALFSSMVDPGDGRPDLEWTEAARAVVRLCGRLPLAIRIAAARMVAHPEWTPATLVRRLDDARRRLDELRYVDLDVRASFAASTTSLDPGLLRLFALLGLLDLDHVTTPVAAAIAGRPPRAVQAGLDALVEAQLLGGLDPERYVLHDLIRLYANELALTELDNSERDNAILRGLHHYVATLRDAANVLTPPKEPRLSIGIAPSEVSVTGASFGSRTEAADWVDAEAGNLLTIARQSSRAFAHHSVAIALSAAAAGPLHSRGYVRILADLAGIAIGAAESAGDERGLAQAHNDLAIGLMGTEYLDVAVEHVERAQRIWTRTGDLICQAGALTNLGILYHQRGQVGAAESNYLRALEIHRRLGNDRSQAAILCNLGEVFTGSGAFERALTHLDEALSLYRKDGAVGGEGYVLGKLGELHLRASDPARAVSHLERGIRLVAQVERRGFEAEFWWHLGTAHRALGQLKEAVECQRQALSMLQQTGAITADRAAAILAQPAPATPSQFR